MRLIMHTVWKFQQRVSRQIFILSTKERARSQCNQLCRQFHSAGSVKISTPYTIDHAWTTW